MLYFCGESPQRLHLLLQLEGALYNQSCPIVGICCCRPRCWISPVYLPGRCCRTMVSSSVIVLGTGAAIWRFDKHDGQSAGKGFPAEFQRMSCYSSTMLPCRGGQVPPTTTQVSMQSTQVGTYLPINCLEQYVYKQGSTYQYSSLANTVS